MSFKDQDYKFKKVFETSLDQNLNLNFSRTTSLITTIVIAMLKQKITPYISHRNT